MLNKIIFFTCLLLCSFSSFAQDRVGNGGDRFADAFISDARYALKLLLKTDLSEQQKSWVDVLKKNVEVVVVNSTEDDLVLGSAVVDAINYPDTKRILVSRKRWRMQNQDKKSTYLGLVLHEYLGVSGFDDRTYALSQQLMNLIQFQVDMDDSSRVIYLYNLSTAQSQAIDILLALDSFRKTQGYAEARSFCAQVARLNSSIDTLQGPLMLFGGDPNEQLGPAIVASASILVSRCDNLDNYALINPNYFDLSLEFINETLTPEVQTLYRQIMSLPENVYFFF